MATAVTGRPIQSAHASRLVRMLDKYFYSGMSLLIFVLVTVAFSRTVPDNLIRPKIAPPHMLWLHGVVFYGWVLFFILQSGLVKIHKTRWHRTIGWFGVALGIAVFGLGVSTTIVMKRFEVLTYQMDRQLAMHFIYPQLWDMMCFAVAFSLAILWRKKLEYHRRLMLVATCPLTVAAWVRLPLSFLSQGPWGADLLIMMGVARDLIVNRKIHRVYLISLPLLIVGQIAIPKIIVTEWWMRFAHAILF